MSIKRDQRQQLLQAQFEADIIHSQAEVLVDTLGAETDMKAGHDVFSR